MPTSRKDFPRAVLAEPNAAPAAEEIAEDRAPLTKPDSKEPPFAALEAGCAFATSSNNQQKLYQFIKISHYLGVPLTTFGSAPPSFGGVGEVSPHTILSEHDFQN